jgi:hypothetical protein
MQAPNSNCIGSPKPAPAPGRRKTQPRARISGLSLSRATLVPDGRNHTTISFTLARRADVTVCVINSQATVVRQLAERSAAGHVTIPYYGDNRAGQREQAGRYRVLVVASRANGGASRAQATLTVSAP